MTLAAMNYVILGLGLIVDGFYMHSFEIWLACFVVFQAAGMVAYTLLDYRLGHRKLLEAILQDLMWLPFL